MVSGTTETSKTFTDPVAAGVSVSATFKVTSGPAAFNGDLVGNASWAANLRTQSETTIEKVRNVSPIKINEFAISAGFPTNSTDSFIELYNAQASEADISDWTLTEHPTQEPIFSSVKIPAGTKLAAHGFYLLGLSTSALAVPARKGDTTIHVRSTTGLNVGDTVEIDTGSAVDTRKITSLGTAAGNSTRLWQPLPEGPVITIPAGLTNVPFTERGAVRCRRLRRRGRPEDRPRLWRHLSSRRERCGEIRGGHGHRRRQAGHASLAGSGRESRRHQHQGILRRQHFGW